jgi:hypothetical protein
MKLHATLTAALMFLAPIAASAKTVRFYDSRGRYSGRVSSMGNVYDRNGGYAGRIQ